MSRELLFERIKEMKQVQGFKIHFGCGSDILEDFINVDKYCKDPKIMNTDMIDQGWLEGSAAVIYSNHSLEHLPIRHARMALKNWHRTLAKGGYLYLCIPDLEEICRKILDKDTPFFHKYFWYLHTMFGYQCDSGNRNPTLDVELDLGQFHQCGFTQELITHYLIEDGFKIVEVFKYDGYDTPSMFIKATKE